MAVTRADIIARWPALAALPDGLEWTAAIAEAGLQLGADAWGNLLDLGTIHLAAHGMMTAHPDVYGPGPIQSERVGGVSRTYAVTAAAAGGSLSSTPAGLAFLRLRASLGLGYLVV